MKFAIPLPFTLIVLAAVLVLPARSQTPDFASGSTGADGDLIFTVANGATQEFDHLAGTHNGVWNFNTIIVPAGVTVTFPRPFANATPPVIWLAAGSVTIGGTLNLNGEHGKSGAATPGQESKGGPGGFAGGIPGGDGYGPGGGEGLVGSSGPAGQGAYAGAYGNRFLQPLLGGSGGGGAYRPDTGHSISGGGGGGAILVSSSQAIVVTGLISCKAGDDVGVGTIASGSGSGGGIRLVADKIAGTGTLTATPNGRIAIEAFDLTEFNVVTNPFDYYINTNPVATFTIPTPAADIRVVDVDGNGVSAPALGRTANPDVFFADSGPVTISLECSNVPLGSVLTVVVKSTAPGAAAISGQSTPLAGTVALSTATATLTVPAGRGVIHAYASWTP